MAEVAEVRSAVSGRTWTAAALAEEARATARTAPGRPFDEPSTRFCAALSRALLEGEAGRRPELVALGYWLRPAAVARMRAAFEARAPERAVTVPRGVVLHVAPGNVDTIFVHSWVLALLTGNTSVVRVSSRESATTEALLRTVSELLAADEHADVRRRSHLVRTDHDDAVLATLSAAADVRVVWGGDATVAHLRSLPTTPRGKDVVFPDRHSFAIVDVDAVNAADEDGLRRLGEAFFDDAYWFDQGACSSPRLVLWRDGGDLDGARRRLRGAVEDALARRRYEASTGVAISKLVRALEAAAVQDDVRVVRTSDEATWVELPDLSQYERDSTGGGLFFEAVSRDLAADVVALASVRDQTVGCYGLDESTVRGLALAVNGRGVDRFVRLGTALQFDALWDGYDLLQELVRQVVVDV